MESPKKIVFHGFPSLKQQSTFGTLGLDRTISNFLGTKWHQLPQLGQRSRSAPRPACAVARAHRHPRRPTSAKLSVRLRAQPWQKLISPKKSLRSGSTHSPSQIWSK